MSIPKIRTIGQCLEEIKVIDPETAITEWFLRCLCKANLVKHFMSGTKILVDLNDLLSYFNNENGEVAKCI
jgi:hypothetical protein